MDKLMDQALQEGIAKAARSNGSPSVAFTYNDPMVFLEYALDMAEAKTYCQGRGLKTVAVTAGYMHAAPRREFFSKMDAANVDLKDFTDNFYVKIRGGHLQPVLDTLLYIRYNTDCRLEITTLLIPGHNDSDSELRDLSKWVAQELGPDVPLHFSAFHPDWKTSDTRPTTPATLSKARRIALDAGLHHVYTGNVHDEEGGSTYCPVCHHAAIVRDWYEIRRYDLSPQGSCPDCGATIAGRFGKLGKPLEKKRVPVFMRLMA